MTKHYHTQSGYSLLELVIYIALLTLLSVVLVRSLVTVMRTYATAQAYRALQNNGELVMERITREVRAGKTVSTTSCSTTSSSMTITDPDATTAAFSLSSGSVQLNGSALSTSEVTASSLALCSFTTTTGTGVKAKLILTTAKGYTASATFYSTAMLRGI